MVDCCTLYPWCRGGLLTTLPDRKGESLLIEPVKVNKQRYKKKLEGLNAVNEKIFKLEERPMNNEIETSTCQTWFKKFKEEKAVLELALKDKKPQIQSADGLVERLV